jgi:hypothetical protein
MGKASRAKQDVHRRERVSAQRAAERRAQIRNRVLLASGAIAVIIAVVVVFIVVKAGSNTAKPTSNGPTGAALASVVSDTTSVPSPALDAVGAGSVTAKPTPVSGPPLTSGGKPEILYLGTEYCPYCAFERWGMIVALSRFGTFSGLRTVHSASADVFPDTPTFTFYGSTYTSKYLTFTPVEETTNVPQGSSYTTLQKPTPAQQALMAKYDSGLSIPFVDIGNKYVIIGSSVSPQVLAGKSWAQVAASLKDTSSPVAKAVDGTANYITAAICKLTNNQPANACTPAVRSLQSKM